MSGVNIGRDSNTLQMRHFGRGALFDRNVLAIRNGKIESRNRCGNVKRHVIFFREDGDLVRADFVGRVAVGGDAVRAGNDGPHLPRFQKMARHVVR